MDFGHSEPADQAPGLPVALKILVAGGFGAGKTTLVGAVSEIRPLRTEEYLTDESVGVDDISGVELKTTTTVAMDFGRITISDDLVLYLFGTPGQDRFWFVWDELALGAIGAIVLADTRRLAACFPSVDYFERRGTGAAVRRAPPRVRQGGADRPRRARDEGEMAQLGGCAGVTARPIVLTGSIRSCRD